MEPIQWTTEPERQRSKAETDFLFNGGAQDAVERAFADGLLIDYDAQYEGAGNQDLKIVLTFRHKSTMSSYQALPDAACKTE